MSEKKSAKMKLEEKVELLKNAKSEEVHYSHWQSLGNKQNVYILCIFLLVYLNKNRDANLP